MRQRGRRCIDEVQHIVAEDAPYISLWYKTNVAVAQRNLTGIGSRRWRHSRS